MGNTRIHGSIACYRCYKNKDRRCAMDMDNFNDYLSKMESAEGIQTMRTLGQRMAWLLKKLNA